ncbi:MAG: sulfotransferase [Pseudomonadota bacterium]
MTRPIFLLGVGAHKAGTSFLYRALNAHPDIRLSTPKEMHVFDSHFLPDTSANFHRRRAEQLADLLTKEGEQPSDHRKRKTAALLRHVRMHYDLSDYVSYFRELAEEGHLTGDITPAYQMLDEAHFEAIRDLLAPHFDLRIIFLMRDPIERIFSAMRMDDRNTGRQTKLAHERFLKTCLEPKHARRTDYSRLVQALDAVFDADQIYYGFYETLFEKKAFYDIGAVLNVDNLAPDFETKVNASPTLGALRKDDIAIARQQYDHVYRFCMERFGEDRIRAIWANA